jgi:glycosyltransferase involved in cell wall biosynthesis
LERKIKIFFSSTINASFVNEDFSFLDKEYSVRKIIGKGIFHLFKIIFAIPRCDLSFIWFASVYSAFNVFFSRLFGKKSVIVIGGVDVAKEPSINYGIWLNWWKAVLVGYAIRNADKILAVDPFLILEAKRLANYEGKNLVYLPTGYNADFWRPSGPKQNFILSVGVCEDEWRMMKKGYDKLLHAALLLPQINFKIIGIKKELSELIKKEVPKNVEIINFVEKEKLLEYYQRAKVYCQVSYHEGLPNSLCEAMLCECIPLGTDRGGIPTGIGDTGLIVPYGDTQALVDAIKISMELPDGTGNKARLRIIENFPLVRRHKDLTMIIRSLVN